MDLAGVVVTGVGALALGALIWPVRSAWRSGRRYGGLAALSLLVGGLALLAAIVAQGAGASHFATGRFLIGMGVGLAVGLALGCAILLSGAQKLVDSAAHRPINPAPSASRSRKRLLSSAMSGASASSAARNPTSIQCSRTSAFTGVWPMRASTVLPSQDRTTACVEAAVTIEMWSSPCKMTRLRPSMAPARRSYTIRPRQLR